MRLSLKIAVVAAALSCLGGGLNCAAVHPRPGAPVMGLAPEEIAGIEAQCYAAWGAAGMEQELARKTCDCTAEHAAPKLPRGWYHDPTPATPSEKLTISEATALCHEQVAAEMNRI